MSIQYKTPKGTINYFGQSATNLTTTLGIIQQIFKQNGGELLDTPVFEKKEIIMGKYGEEAENKLIYEIAENGGEKLVLRYDLTIPFIRWIQEKNIKKCKRYSVGKVYRRDNPNVSQGRFREFYQCDFDILGESNTTMMSEGVILNMVSQIMANLGISDYKIIINDTENLRKALEQVLTCEALDASLPREGSNVPEVKVDRIKYKSICASIDKLDKVKFDDIRRELVTKGMTESQIDKLEQVLKENSIYDETAKTRLSKLYQIAEGLGYREKIEYSLSLARGLDYYNGLIFEVKLGDSALQTSVMAGGRYDNLVPNSTLIGFSVGVTRLMPFVRLPENKERRYYLTSIGNIDLPTKLRVIKWCQSKLVGTNIFQFSYEQDDKKLVKVLSDQLKAGTSDLLIIGEAEIRENKLIHKDLVANVQKLIDLN